VYVKVEETDVGCGVGRYVGAEDVGEKVGIVGLKVGIVVGVSHQGYKGFCNNGIGSVATGEMTTRPLPPKPFEADVVEVPMEISVKG